MPPTLKVMERYAIKVWSRCVVPGVLLLRNTTSSQNLASVAIYDLLRRKLPHSERASLTPRIRPSRPPESAHIGAVSLAATK